MCHHARRKSTFNSWVLLPVGVTVGCGGKGSSEGFFVCYLCLAVQALHLLDIPLVSTVVLKTLFSRAESSEISCIPPSGLPHPSTSLPFSFQVLETCLRWMTEGRTDTQMGTEMLRRGGLCLLRGVHSLPNTRKFIALTVYSTGRREFQWD